MIVYCKRRAQLSFYLGSMVLTLWTASPAHAQDTRPPTIRHEPVRTGRAGVSIQVQALLVDESEIAFPRLYYRRTGETGYQMVSMEKEGKGFTAVIHGFLISSEGIEYYIEAFDVQGNGPALHGSLDHPHRVEIEALAASSPPIESSVPVYRRWWFWTLAGVLAAGSVTAIVLATRGEDTMDLKVSAPPPRPTVWDMR